MLKKIFGQKRFKSWDEAFRSLTPSMRQHSVRVADYTQILFEGVYRSSTYLKSPSTPDYADEAYREVAYKCGFYHQIGKAFEAEAYTPFGEKMTEEDIHEQCGYTVKGKELAAKLQGEDKDVGNASVPNTMLQETCEGHLERWDGSGYPYGYTGNEIPLIAQVVGLAKELDTLVCGRRSERPFEEAVEILLAQSGKKFSEPLMEVFTACQPELKNIYKKYMQYTKMMPKTVPLVKKRPERPFGLGYQQIMKGSDLAEVNLQATPWFGGVLDDATARESAEDVEQLLVRTGLIKEISRYFLYEAADILARMKNCGMHSIGVILPMFAPFFVGDSQLEELDKMFERTQINKRKLILSVQESFMRNDRTVQKTLAEYLSGGVTLMLDNYHPESFPIDLVREIGFTHVRFSQDSLAWGDYPAALREMQSLGITVIDWPTGDTHLTEDDMIRYLLDLQE